MGKNILPIISVFERRQGSSAGAYEEDSPLAIQQLALCAESRRLAVAFPHGHVVLFKFRKAETHTETQVPFTCEKRAFYIVLVTW